MVGIVVGLGIIICVAVALATAPVHCAYDEAFECPNCHSHSNCLECYRYRQYMRDAEIKAQKFGGK